MSLLMIPVLLLGPVLLIASLVVKRTLVRALCLLVGVSVCLWVARIFAGIPMAYEREHRTVENQYHRQIIGELGSMLANGQTNEAKALVEEYLVKTEDSSFMRNPLHEIVQSMQTGETEHQPAP
jgi:hypothetical protein